MRLFHSNHLESEQKSYYAHETPTTQFLLNISYFIILEMVVILFKATLGIFEKNIFIIYYFLFLYNYYPTACRYRHKNRLTKNVHSKNEIQI